MSESMVIAKTSLEKVMDTLRSTGDASKGATREMLTRLQSAHNTLVQNENKIWLRTKAGKALLSSYSEASQRLLAAVEAGLSREELDAALGEVSLVAKSLDDEVRKRSMVVT